MNLNRDLGYLTARTLRRKAAKICALDLPTEDDEFLLPTQPEEAHFNNEESSPTDTSSVDRSHFSLNSDQISMHSDTSSTEMDFEGTQSVEERFGAIVTKHRLTRSAIKDLANLLVSLGHNIHIDARTICKTPRVKLDTDSFKHFGFIKGLVLKLKSGLIGSSGNEFKLQFSIDGSNIFNSGTTDFWPILCRVSNAIDSRPFPVSVFCGDGEKPPDLNLYFGGIETLRRERN